MDTRGHSGPEGIPVERPAEEMHADHGLRPRSDGRSYLGDVQVERLWLDIDEHRSTAAELDRVRRRREGVRRHDYLVTRADAERDHREMQRGSPRRDDDCVGRPARIGERTLELGNLRPHRQLARRDDLGELCDLDVSDVGLGEPDRIGHTRCPRYQAIVRCRPSSSSISASKPSSSRAFAMFGMRNSTSV